MKKEENKLTIILLGRSGCGKDTQSEYVIKRLRTDSTWRVETGRFLREVIKKDNPTMAIARKEMQDGKLFPSWMSSFTWLKGFIEENAADKHLVFDGAPRRLWEARLLSDVLLWHGRPLPVCIYIDVTEKEATRRLLVRKRADDTMPAIKNRMQFFKEDVLKVSRYYKKQGLLIHIKSDEERDIVWKSIDQALQKRLGKIWPKQ